MVEVRISVTHNNNNNNNNNHIKRQKSREGFGLGVLGWYIGRSIYLWEWGEILKERNKRQSDEEGVVESADIHSHSHSHSQYKTILSLTLFFQLQYFYPNPSLPVFLSSSSSSSLCVFSPLFCFFFL